MQVVRKRVLYLRGLLWIDRANGFVAAGEWGSSSALRLRATHLESLVRPPSRASHIGRRPAWELDFQ